MTDTINTILKRRSVRGFTSTPIKDDDLQLILQCGLYAPTAMNQQNWHFTVVRNAELLSEINIEVRKTLSPETVERMVKRSGENYSIFYGASTAVFVSADEKSAAFAAENMCLAAESLGLGTCIIGLAASLFQCEKGDYYKDLLKMPKALPVQFAVAIGYKNMEMPVPERTPHTITFIE